MRIIALYILLGLSWATSAQVDYLRYRNSKMYSGKMIVSFKHNANSDTLNLDSITTSNFYTPQVESNEMGNIVFLNNQGYNYLNRNFQLMPNSIQSPVGKNYYDNNQHGHILKIPHQDSLYLVFDRRSGILDTSKPNKTYDRALYIHTVNMKLDSGRGDIVTPPYGIPFGQWYYPVFGQIPDKKGNLWLITFYGDSNAYHVFRVTEKGIDTVPVASQTYFGNSGSTVSPLRVFPDGSKIAFFKGNAIEIDTFDSETGKLTPLNYISGSAPGLTGFEISPNGRFIYYSEDNYSGIWRYDLSSQDDYKIQQSLARIYKPTNYSGEIRKLYLGPDCRIYFIHDGSGTVNHLGVITEPNRLGTSVIDTLVNLYYFGGQGLPESPRHYFHFNNEILTFYDRGSKGTEGWFPDSILISDEFCLGDTIRAMNAAVAYGNNSWQVKAKVYAYDSLTQTTHCAWNNYPLSAGTGRGTKVMTGTGCQQAGIADSAVLFKMAVYNACSDTLTDTITKFIPLYPLPVAILTSDTILCWGDSLVLHASAGNPNHTMHYEWSTGDTSESIIIKQTGKVVLKVSWGNHASYDTMQVNVFNNPNLGNDTAFCNLASYTLNGGVATPAHYQWNTGDTTPQISISNTGQYYLHLSNGQGCQSDDTINLVFWKQPVSGLPTDTLVCGSQATTLVGGTPAQSYLWNTGDTTATLPVNTAGTYTVTITNGLCQTIDSSVVTIGTMPQVNLGNDTAICDNKLLALDAGTGAGYTYLWNTGNTTQTITVGLAGTYSVKVYNQQCTGSDSLTLTIKPVPYPSIIRKGNTLEASNTYNTYQWYNGSIFLGGDTQKTYLPTKAGSYYVEVTDSTGCSGFSDSFAINLGVQKVEAHTKMYIYPNPTKDILTIELKNLTQGQLTLTNMLGQVVLTQAVKESKTMIDMGKLAKGMYILNLTTQEGNSYREVVVKE